MVLLKAFFNTWYGCLAFLVVCDSMSDRADGPVIRMRRDESRSRFMLQVLYVLSSAVGAGSSPVNVLYMLIIPRYPFKFRFDRIQSSGPLSFGIFDASMSELMTVWSDILGETGVVKEGRERRRMEKWKGYVIEFLVGAWWGAWVVS